MSKRVLGITLLGIRLCKVDLELTFIGLNLVSTIVDRFIGINYLFILAKPCTRNMRKVSMGWPSCGLC